MVFDRRGDIGFMEAMAGTMIVCLVMTAFTAHLAAEAVAGDRSPEEFDWNMIGSVYVSDGRYVVTVDGNMEGYFELTGIRGLTVRAGSPALNGIGPYSRDFGDISGDSLAERKLIPVLSDDGRTIPTVVEVILFV